MIHNIWKSRFWEQLEQQLLSLKRVCDADQSKLVDFHIQYSNLRNLFSQSWLGQTVYISSLWGNLDFKLTPSVRLATNKSHSILNKLNLASNHPLTHSTVLEILQHGKLRLEIPMWSLVIYKYVDSHIGFSTRIWLRVIPYWHVIDHQITKANFER